MKLLLATTNQAKLLEQRLALEGLRIEILSLADFPAIEAPEETGATFLENARIKALYYHRAIGLPTLGEDAGLVVEALGGLPGVQSARWLGAQTSFAEKSARLLELLEGVEAEKRTARFMCAVAVAQDERVVFEHEAACEGRVAFELRGSGGFGYDPVFYYPPLGKTTAELTPLEKLRVSHRGKAMAALKLWLSGRFDPR